MMNYVIHNMDTDTDIWSFNNPIFWYTGHFSYFQNIPQHLLCVFIHSLFYTLPNTHNLSEGWFLPSLSFFSFHLPAL